LDAQYNWPDDLDVLVEDSLYVCPLMVRRLEKG
jgi:hypothetical protein